MVKKKVKKSAKKNAKKSVKKSVKKKKTVKKAKKKRAAKAKPKRSKLEVKMAELGRQVASLEMKARRASTDTRKEIEATIKDLQSKTGRVQKEMDQMKAAGTVGWGDIAVGIDSAIDDLKDACARQLRALNRRPLSSTVL